MESQVSRRGDRPRVGGAPCRRESLQYRTAPAVSIARSTGTARYCYSN